MIEKAQGREGIIQPPFLSLPPPSEVWCIWPVIYRLYGKYSPVQQRALIQELYLSHRDVFHISQDERERESERFTITFSDRDNSPSVSQTHYGTISLEYKCHKWTQSWSFKRNLVLRESTVISCTSPQCRQNKENKTEDKIHWYTISFHSFELIYFIKNITI